MNISQFLTKLKTLVYSKNEVDTKLSAVVHTSGAEDISGNKNFIDNLTCSGKNVDAIEEQGYGYIRYSSGIQICWGLGTYQSGEIVSFQRAFIEYPSVVLSGDVNAGDWSTTNFVMMKDSNYPYNSWLAIGRWKRIKS